MKKGILMLALLLAGTAVADDVTDQYYCGTGNAGVICRQAKATYLMRKEARMARGEEEADVNERIALNALALVATTPPSGNNCTLTQVGNVVYQNCN